MKWLYKYSSNEQYRLKEDTVGYSVNLAFPSVIYFCVFSHTVTWMQPNWLSVDLSMMGLNLLPRRLPPLCPTHADLYNEGMELETPEQM